MEWSHPNPMEFSAAIGLVSLALLMLARRAARSPDARSLLLVALRASALAVLVAILLDPVRTIETTIPGDRPTAIFLVDGSRSMGLERPTTRLDRVGREIDRAERLIAPERMPAIERYRFGRTLSATSPGETPRAVDDESRLLDALERLPSRFGPNPPFGVFVFSDGRTPETSGFEDVAEGYKKLGVPIHVLPVGDSSISGDVSIRDLVFPRDAPKGSKIAVKVVVGSRGFAGRRAEVAIRPSTGADVRPLATLPLTLVDGDVPTELVIEADRAHAPLVAEVLPLPGESVAENNSIPFQVAARNNKIRVIYMEGSQESEIAYIRDALVENPDIECMAMGIDAQMNFKQTLHRLDDPSKGYPTTREELLGFDVVICSDIAKSAFTPQQIEWTVELVAKRGGGFAMVGGHTSFGSGGWDKTPWDGMIPIDMSGNGPGQYSAFYNGYFQVVVPPGLETHPIWRIVDDPTRNREILARMPQFSGTNLTDRLKPAAVLLGLSDHPLTGMEMQPQGYQLQKKRKAQGPTGTPIFSAQPYGKGRSFAMSTDSTASWGSAFETTWGEGDNRYFRKFWRNVVTWLAENSSGASRNLEIATDKIIYRPGQSIQVTAKAFDEKLDPTDRYRLVARLVRADVPDKKPIPNAPAPPPLVPDSPLTSRAESRDFAAHLPIPPAESIRGANGPSLHPATVEVVAMDGERTVSRASLDVQVLDDSDEFRDPRPDPPRLASLASHSGGSVMTGPDDLANLLQHSTEDVDRVVTTRAPLWDTPTVMGLVFALLVAEWTIRRWKGLA
jgi:uncharacterized membrane protein